MYTVSQCQGSGKLRSSSATTAIFDANLGTANFSNFYIDNSGMYLISINVRAAQDSNYNFSCLSEPITVKKGALATNIDTTIAPNMLFNFSGDFSSLSNDKIKEMKNLFYNCLIHEKSLNTNDEIVIYKGSIMVATYLDSSSYGSISDVIAYLNRTNLTLGDGILLRSAVINDQTTVFRTVADPVSNNIISDSGSSSSSGSNSNSNSLSDEKNSVEVLVYLYFIDILKHKLYFFNREMLELLLVGYWVVFL